MLKHTRKLLSAGGARVHEEVQHSHALVQHVHAVLVVAPDAQVAVALHLAARRLDVARPAAPRPGLRAAQASPLVHQAHLTLSGSPSLLCALPSRLARCHCPGHQAGLAPTRSRATPHHTSASCPGLQAPQLAWTLARGTGRAGAAHARRVQGPGRASGAHMSLSSVLLPAPFGPTSAMRESQSTPNSRSCGGVGNPAQG